MTGASNGAGQLLRWWRRLDPCVAARALKLPVVGVTWWGSVWAKQQQQEGPFLTTVLILTTFGHYKRY